jgi:hypothetical protein
MFQNAHKSTKLTFFNTEFYLALFSIYWCILIEGHAHAHLQAPLQLLYLRQLNAKAHETHFWNPE